MATIDGAKALNWDKEIGSIEIGKKADMIMVDIDQINALPLYDPISHLVYSSSGKDVTMTMVGGNILYHNGQFKTLDLDRVKAAAKKYQEN